MNLNHGKNFTGDGGNVNGLNNYENEHLLSPLQWVAFNGNLTRFNLLMNDVNYTNPVDVTPLNSSSLRNEHELCFYVDCCNINAKDKTCRTALIYAASHAFVK